MLVILQAHFGLVSINFFNICLYHRLLLFFFFASVWLHDHFILHQNRISSVNDTKMQPRLNTVSSVIFCSSYVSILPHILPIVFYFIYILIQTSYCTLVLSVYLSYVYLFNSYSFWLENDVIVNVKTLSYFIKMFLNQFFIAELPTQMLQYVLNYS